MFLFKVLLPALALVASTNALSISSPNSISKGDQYQKREAKELPSQPLSRPTPSEDVDATDRTLKNSPDGILYRTLTNQNLARASNSQKRYASNSPTDHNDHRLKRSYYPYQATYQIQWPQFDTLNSWKPNFYPIQRPYFVPIYGYDGRIPLYYPQLTYFNSGKPPYVGPTYLPPVGPTYLPPVTTTSPPSVTTSSPTNDTTMMPIDDRFGDNDDDERPIWDNGNGAPYPNPSTPKSGLTPTRKTMSSTSTFPPLVRPTDAPKSVNHLSNDKTEDNEVATIPPSIPRPQGPSKCVWAIVSCCSTGSKDVSYECFDQLGCAGPFWDVNPCDTEYAKAAIQTALNYYNSRF